MTEIKICGLSRKEDMDAVNREKPEYIGFVFAKSRRQVTQTLALALRDKLAPGIRPVGVFADAPIEEILSSVRLGVIDLIQLHGSEDEEYLRKVKALSGKPVIRAVSVLTEADAGKWGESAADYLLLDSAGGGTGQRFDWSLIGEIPKPFFLAGGLHPGNLREALAKLHPFALDVSSGVETDGVKDPEKIREFIRRVRHG